MRKFIATVGGILAATLIAATSAVAVEPTPAQAPAPHVRAADIAPAPTPVAAPRIAEYDVKVSKVTTPGTGESAPVELQSVNLWVLENKDARSHSKTQTVYVCEDKKRQVASTCTVSHGYSVSISDTHHDEQSGQVHAKVSMKVEDLVRMDKHVTPKATYEDPIISTFHVEQLTSLAPGGTVEGVSGDYKYEIKLVQAK